LLIAFCSAQGFVDIFFIDNFDVNSPTQVIVTPQNPTFPISKFNSIQNNAILGGERDLFVEVETGVDGVVFSASVAGGNYSASAPNGATGFSSLTYDGKDNSNNINPGGLAGSANTNWRANGGFAFRISVRVDLPTDATLRVYSGNINAYCEFVLNLPASDNDNIYLVNFDTDFKKVGSGCDFTNVGAFQIGYDMKDSVDILSQFMSVWAPVASTLTPSPSPSPVSTSSPTPTISAVCACFCPNFTCELIRHQPDQPAVGFFNSGGTFFTTFFTAIFPTDIACTVFGICL